MAGVKPAVMHPVLSVLDTGVRPNLVSDDFRRPELKAHIKPSSDPGLVAARNEAITIQGVILLHVRLSDLRVCA